MHMIIKLNDRNILNNPQQILHINQIIPNILMFKQPNQILQQSILPQHPLNPTNIHILSNPILRI